MASLQVLATGPLALCCDLGRPGLAAFGVPRSGAADRASYLLGQRLLGHSRPLTAVEVTLGGLSLRADSSVLVALTGADADATIDAVPVAAQTPCYLLPGQVLALRTPRAGLRTYVGVRGGLDVPPVLGSASRDTLSGIGPSALAVGDVLPVGPGPTTPFADLDVAPVPPLPHSPLRLEFLPGPRDDWFADLGELTGTAWTASTLSNRVGVRLEGGRLRRRPERSGELPSEGVVRGAIQVPSSGEPVIFLADHPVTGGYPVVGVLTERSCDLAAQARPGDRLRFYRARDTR